MLTIHDESVRGFEDGYYGLKAEPRAFHRELYMTAFWEGRAQRDNENKTLNALCHRENAETTA